MNKEDKQYLEYIRSEYGEGMILYILEHYYRLKDELDFVVEQRTNTRKQEEYARSLHQHNGAD